jgi:hypothetical protein
VPTHTFAPSDEVRPAFHVEGPKPKNKHERNAAKALARSKRNSPPKGKEALGIYNRKSRRRTSRGFKKLGTAFEGMGVAASAASPAVKGLAKQLAKVQEMEQERRIELDGMKKDELKDIARTLKIRRFTMFKKDELIAAIVKSEGF